jgi:general secretion pathway protein E/type IV pilus assembly protein PilB
VTPPPIRIGDLLINKGIIQKKHLDFALQVQRVSGEKLGQVLTRVGLVSEYELVHTVAEQLKLECLDLTREAPDLEVLKRFNRNTCLSLQMFPLKVVGDAVHVITPDLPNQAMEQACLRFMGMKPVFSLAAESQVISAIYNYFFFLTNPVEQSLQREADILAADTTRTVSPDNFLNFMLLMAIKRRATDVHIRPMAYGISLAFRIDGVLTSERFFPKQLMRIVTSIKLQSGMDISEQRLPQDGRWSVTLLQRNYDIRVSTTVTPYGENVVMRLLSQERASFSLENLGFMKEDLKPIMRSFEEPFGIVLLTGPTGSGKSTTLVAGLSALDLLGKNVLTIENPIEYIVPLARQTQVNEPAGYDFANAMRYFLRHDPDVILIGEMRDELTARTALDAATTGHLVLSTLHSNTALGAIPRLATLGLDHQTMAEALVSVISQRLVRTICKQCKEACAPTPEDLKYLGVTTDKLYRGRGCDLCGHTGYLGRTLVYEVFMLDREVRGLLEKNAPMYQIEEMASAKGFQTMFSVGVKKALAGQTTAEELRRVLGATRY